MTEADKKLPDHIKGCFVSGPIKVGEGGNKNYPYVYVEDMTPKSNCSEYKKHWRRRRHEREF